MPRPIPAEPMDPAAAQVAAEFGVLLEEEERAQMLCEILIDLYDDSGKLDSLRNNPDIGCVAKKSTRLSFMQEDLVENYVLLEAYHASFNKVALALRLARRNGSSKHPKIRVLKELISMDSEDDKPEVVLEDSVEEEGEEDDQQSEPGEGEEVAQSSDLMDVEKHNEDDLPDPQQKKQKTNDVPAVKEEVPAVKEEDDWKNHKEMLGVKVGRRSNEICHQRGAMKVGVRLLYYYFGPLAAWVATTRSHRDFLCNVCIAGELRPLWIIYGFVVKMIRRCQLQCEPGHLPLDECRAVACPLRPQLQMGTDVPSAAPGAPSCKLAVAVADPEDRALVRLLPTLAT
ncbi:unnamed protein product [Polarella glacialis]|uniref:Uncharacterized protein n=1 Tax=Polarella glacialis TaxID=89957 RepID=A0A813G3T9_POLGL|nr:unnamed protein product [Polarella glacialis]